MLYVFKSILKLYQKTELPHFSPHATVTELKFTKENKDKIPSELSKV